MKKVNWMITEQNVTVNFDNQTHILARTDKFADELIQAIRDKDWDSIPNLISLANRVLSYSEGNFLVKDGAIFINGFAAPEVLSNKILNFMDQKLPYEPLIKFAEKLQNNTSFRAVKELFGFLEKNDHPITENGNFIAYKRVRSTFKDIYTNTMDNSVGTVVQVLRNEVDEDCTRTCSNGLHVANWDYAHTKFASNDSSTDIMLEVEVDPADVVAIPVDYNNSKMRVCKYKVLGVVDSEHSSKVHLRVTNHHDYSDDSDDCDDCDDSDDCEDCEDCESCNRESSDDDDDKYPWEDEI